MEQAQKTVRVRIGGIVQGVGFRPFLHRLAREYGLGGRAWNDTEGVELLLSGSEEKIRAMLQEMQAKPPRLARIERLMREETSLPPYSEFRILPSRSQGAPHAGVSSDIGICEDCLFELFDPQDRRYRYPFINCTNCGPRFTILRDIPYDRANTSMRAFPMCEKCAEEYHDIENRRYHAQPDCCDSCGPRVFFLDAKGASVEGEPIECARSYLKAGRVIAVKGLGGIHLACDAFSKEAVAALRRGKQRDERPFALMCADLAAARVLCEVSEYEAECLQSPRRPIVLLRKKGAWLAHCSDNRYLGIMLPYTPLHYLLMGEDIKALVMTSANLHEKPILYENETALRELFGIADGFLLHEREIIVPCDDSLLYCVDGKPYPLRRSRGFVPESLFLPFAAPEALACGAEQKASFAFSKGGEAFLSQHIGDMKNLETLELYENMTAHFSRLFDIRPRALACDLHPDYLSTAYAQERAAREGLPLLRVQHHHAHMAACMADNELRGACIGIVWDGTGYGTDGRIWGGEFFTGDYRAVKRVGSIRPILLAGGDAAVREISRVAIALALDAGEALPDFCRFSKRESIEAMLRAGLNCPLSTGMGRLFDGVYALLTGRARVSYEGQGAVLLEAMADENEAASYPVAFYQEEERRVFDHRVMLRALLKEIRSGEEKEHIAARFMNTLCEMALLQCQAIREESGLGRVVLSGGVFLNQYLLKRIGAGLAEAGFAVYHHSRVSTNDEGIAFGQLAILAAQREET